MPYDSGLDEQKFSKFFDTANGRIIVSIYSYNSGPNKLQLAREIKNADGNFTFTKLGRISKEELQGIMPLIQEAIAAM
ncbi:MAG: hypothetical protein ABH865_05945 [Candidatus Omnitrophota bacterium]